MKFLFIAALALYAGCSGQPSGGTFLPSSVAPCTRFGPDHIDILPITSVVPAAAADRDSAINAYICLLDSFNTQIKSPAVFRFELFQHVQRSTDPKGKRLTFWPDIDLSHPDNNNKYWQDFLRAYLFTLPLQKISSDNTILHVTCFPPSGQRLSADFLIRSASAR
jgi:hypothetical protein